MRSNLSDSHRGNTLKQRHFEVPHEYLNLMRSVIDAACKDYLGISRRFYEGSRIKTQQKMTEIIQKEAKEWFLADEDDGKWPFSFHTICQTFGWNESAIKRRIREREHEGNRSA